MTETLALANKKRVWSSNLSLRGGTDPMQLYWPALPDPRVYVKSEGTVRGKPRLYLNCLYYSEQLPLALIGLS